MKITWSIIGVMSMVPQVKRKKMNKKSEKNKKGIHSADSKPSDFPDKEATEFYNSHYFVINQNTLKIMGLWPYQNKVVKTVIRVFILIMFIISMIPQVIGAIVLKKQIARLVQSMGTFFYVVAIAAKFVTLIISEDKMKVLYENLVRNWKMLENEEERSIMEKHSKFGRVLTIVYFTYMISAMWVFICLPVAPRLINMITPMFNGSLIEMFILEGEYLIDKKEYYYYVYFLEAFCVITTVPVYTTIDAAYAVCVEQCVGLLAIVELRLELATKHYKTSKLNGQQEKDRAYSAIAKSSELHEKVLNYGRVLESVYSRPFLFALSFNTLSLAASSLCCLFHLHDPMNALRFIAIIFGFCIHMFYLSWPGQKLIDGSNAIFYAAYDNEWYECSVESQKLLKFIMQRTIEPFYLTAGGFYIVNFENFEMLMQTSLSYITVIASFK